MSEVATDKGEASPASLIADLTNTATGILDTYPAEVTSLENGSQARKVTASNVECSLVETMTAEGVRSFKYIRPAVIIQFGATVLHTTEWQEGSSNVKVIYESEEIGKRSATTTDRREISYYTHLYLRNQFPMTEEQKPTVSYWGRLRTFLGSLPFRKKQDSHE